MIGLLVWASLAPAQTAAPSKAAQTKCEGTEAPGTHASTPVDPYPLNAAGWGPEVGNGLLFSRLAENWTGMRTASYARPFKAMPLGGRASLDFNGYCRDTCNFRTSRLGRNLKILVTPFEVRYNGEKIGQGKENAKEFLRENPAIAAEVEAKIRANAKTLADIMPSARTEED